MDGKHLTDSQSKISAKKLLSKLTFQFFILDFSGNFAEYAYRTFVVDHLDGSSKWVPFLSALFFGSVVVMPGFIA